MAITAGIDVGTQSSKVLIYDSVSKEILAEKGSSHQLISKDDGTREQEAKWWLEAIKNCFDSIPSDVKKKIQAVGVSGQQHGFVPVDDKGTVLSPVKLWCDTSTIKECAEITETIGSREKLIKIAGNEMKTGYTAPKILWFKKNCPEIYRRMRWIMLPHDYVNFFLTGQATMEYGDASGTALLDVRTRTWSDEILKAIDLERNLKDCLPKLINYDEIAGYVCKRASDYFGIPAGISVSCGGGDNMMGAIGTGTVSPGDLTMSMGTSGTLYGASDKPVVDDSGCLAAFCSSTGNWLPLLCTMNCTVSSELTRQLFNFNIEELNEIAASAPIDCDGVIMLPYFNGERTPNYPNGKGCIFGLNNTNMTKANICRAAMESSVFSMKYGLDSFTALGFTGKRIKLIGGGSNSHFWRQMVADVTGLPVVTPKNPEAAAFGGALQSLFVLEKESGKTSSICSITEEHVKLKEEFTCIPDMGRHSEYAEIYKNWISHVEVVAPIYK